MKISGLAKEDLVDATKKLQKVFKEWFYKRSQDIMPKYCDKLNYSAELKELAQRIIEKIHTAGWIEGCQPLTQVGVALYTLNKRLEEIKKKSKINGFVIDPKVVALLHEWKDPQTIASVVDKGLPAIRDKYEKICDNEMDIFPDQFLFDFERKHLKMGQQDVISGANANKDRFMQQHPVQRQNVQQNVMPQQQHEYRGAPQYM